MPLLRLDGIRRDYDGTVPTTALRGVDLTIQAGEFIAIEGPSGGGKSTLLNIIGLLDSPSAGRYLIDDQDAAEASAKRRAQLRSDTFSFIFQSFHLLDRRPVIQSVELGLVYRGVRRAQRTALAREALGTVGLEHLAEQIPAKLSGGERQRVAIARALASGAPVVVADEPTGNLDSENSAAIVESLARLNRAGATVVLVTHSPEVASSAHRRVRVRDGRIEESEESIPADRATDAPSQWSAPPGRASVVRFRDLMRDAGSSVSSRVARTAGLVAAVAVGVALAVATIGISVSANAQVSATFNAHTNRDVTVSWTPDTFAAVPASEAQPADIAKRLESLNGVTSAGVLSSYGAHDVQLGPTRRTFTANVYAMTNEVPAAARQSITWAAGHPRQLGSDEVIVGRDLATQVELGPLDAGPQLLLDSRTATVVGIATESPRLPELMSAVIAPTSDSALLGYNGQTQAVILTDTGAAQLIAGQAPWAINPYEPTALQVSAPTDPTAVRAQIESAVQTTLFALTGVAFLASIAGLANAMMLSVLERRQELGLRRALGARPSQIAALILIESTIIGAIGGIVGLALGLGGTLAVTIFRQWAPVFDLSIAPAAVVAGIVVGAMGGLLASLRASRIQPSEALRQ